MAQSKAATMQLFRMINESITGHNREAQSSMKREEEQVETSQKEIPYSIPLPTRPMQHHQAAQTKPTAATASMNTDCSMRKVVRFFPHAFEYEIPKASTDTVWYSRNELSQIGILNQRIVARQGTMASSSSSLPSSHQQQAQQTQAEPAMVDDTCTRGLEQKIPHIGKQRNHRMKESWNVVLQYYSRNGNNNRDHQQHHEPVDTDWIAEVYADASLSSLRLAQLRGMQDSAEAAAVPKRHQTSSLSLDNSPSSVTTFWNDPPSRHCNTTRRCSKQQPSKTVTFDDDDISVHDHIHLNDIDDDEHAATWFQPHQFQEMKRERQLAIRKLKQRNYRECDDCVLRGLALPHMAVPRKERRKAAWRAVFEEQECQNAQQTLDHDEIADSYRSVSMVCAKLARQVGMQDEQDVAEDISNYSGHENATPKSSTSDQSPVSTTVLYHHYPTKILDGSISNNNERFRFKTTKTRVY